MMQSPASRIAAGVDFLEKGASLAAGSENALAEHAGTCLLSAASARAWVGERAWSRKNNPPVLRRCTDLPGPEQRSHTARGSYAPGRICIACPAAARPAGQGRRACRKARPESRGEGARHLRLHVFNAYRRTNLAGSGESPPKLPRHTTTVCRKDF
jgi:hypothetical protein